MLFNNKIIVFASGNLGFKMLEYLKQISKIEFIAKEHAKNSHPFVDWDSIKVIPQFNPDNQPMQLIAPACPIGTRYYH